MVLWFSEDRAFGYIRRENGGDDAFVHRGSVQGNMGIGTLTDGERVEFDVVQGERGQKGPIAENVVRLDWERDVSENIPWDVFGRGFHRALLARPEMTRLPEPTILVDHKGVYVQAGPYRVGRDVENWIVFQTFEYPETLASVFAMLLLAQLEADE